MAKSVQKVVAIEERGLGSPLPVRLSQIERYEDQPRRFFNQDGLEELGRELMDPSVGQKTPVRVCKHSTKRGVFVLIGGERRWRAFHLVANWTNTDPIVMCFIDVIHDERHHFREAFLDNLLREDLIPLDEAAAYKRLYDESNANSHHAKIVEVAGLAKKSFTHVDGYMLAHTLPQEVKDLMGMERPRDQRLTITAAVDIARSTRDQALQLEIAKEALERDLGIVDTRNLIGIKTGKAGFDVARGARRPSDNYKNFKNFLGGTHNRARRIQEGMDIPSLYLGRDDADGDRQRDAVKMQDVIKLLGLILDGITNEQSSKRRPS